MSSKLRAEKPAPKPTKPPPKTKRSPSKNGQMRREISVSGRGLAAIDDPSSVHEWDDEELARGYKRAPDGTFRGRPPTIIPREVHLEIQRRHIDKAAAFFIEHAADVAEVLWTIANDGKEDARARVQAANSILDRALGKPSGSSTIDVTIHEPAFVQALRGALVELTPGDDYIDVDGEEVA